MEIVIKLPPAAVQYVVTALEDKPHREVRGLIDTIMEQANAQLDLAPLASKVD